MGYSTSTPTTASGVPAQSDTNFWQKLASDVGGVWDTIKGIFSWGSGYPKPLPPPLPFTTDQVAAMLSRSPTVLNSLVQHMENESQHDWNVYMGSPGAGLPIPTPTYLKANLQAAAAAGIWFANGGPGKDLSHGEANIRGVIVQGMYNYAPATIPSTGAGTGTTTTGGGGTQTPPVTQASMGGWGWLLALGAAGYAARKMHLI